MIYLHASRLIAQLALTLEIPCVEMINMPRDPEAGGWCQFPGIDRLATRWNTAVVTPSHFIETQLVERGVPADDIHVIHSWVDAERFYRPERREAVRAERHIDNDTPLILNVGRLSPEKAHDDLLPVAARVAAEHPKALFVIVGRGPMEDEIRRRIRRMNLKDNVRLLGFVEDMPDLYAAADLMLHTARREAFATVILEGMAAGLPIVATNVGGTPEQIDDGRTGLLADPGNTHAMARAICNLLADEDRRRELGRQAHLKAVNDFRPEPAVAAYARLFEGVVEGH
jgi:glycosyltransferase involved in cell wall biosynthesis